MQEVITVNTPVAQLGDEIFADKVRRIKQILDRGEFFEIQEKDVTTRTISVGSRHTGSRAIVIIVPRSSQ